MSGYIALHRQVLEWEWWDDHNTSRLFITCLLLANHKDASWKGIPVKRGQFITSYESLSKKTGISIQSVRTSVAKLEKSKNLTFKSTNKYSILTIEKYEEYQSGNKQLTDKPTINQQTTNKQLTTNNNDNNNNKEIGGLPDDELWFAGDVIRLTEDDYFKWVKMSGMDKLELWKVLEDRDDWYMTQPKTTQKSWFMATSKFLQR